MRKILSVLMVLCYCSASEAQQVEERAIVIAELASLRNLAGPSGVVRRGEFVRIDEKKFGLYRVTWRGYQGWIKPSNVIPVNQGIEYFTNAIREDPTASNYDCRGIDWYEQGELDNALDDFDSAICLDPNHYAIYMNRGIVFATKGESEKALTDFDEAIRLFSKDAAVYYNRAVAWSMENEIDKAISDYTQAILLEPKYQSAYSNRGVLWLKRREYDKAIADFDNSIRLDPKDVTAYECRGSAWDYKGELEKALADFDQAIRLNPTNAKTFNNRAATWVKKGEHDKFLSDLNEAIRLNPDYYLAYCNRCVAWTNRGEYGKALSDLEHAIRINPKSASAYNGSAWILATCPDEKYRDGKKAIEYSTKACEIDGWKESRYIGTLAAAYAEAGDFDQAIEYVEKANARVTDDDVKVIREAMLASFKQRRPYREEATK